MFLSLDQRQLLRAQDEDSSQPQPHPDCQHDTDWDFCFYPSQQTKIPAHRWAAFHSWVWREGRRHQSQGEGHRLCFSKRQRPNPRRKQLSWSRKTMNTQANKELSLGHHHLGYFWGRTLEICTGFRQPDLWLPDTEASQLRPRNTLSPPRTHCWPGREKRQGEKKLLGALVIFYHTLGMAGFCRNMAERPTSPCRGQRAKRRCWRNYRRRNLWITSLRGRPNNCLGHSLLGHPQVVLAWHTVKKQRPTLLVPRVTGHQIWSGYTEETAQAEQLRNATRPSSTRSGSILSVVLCSEVSPQTAGASVLPAWAYAMSGEAQQRESQQNSPASRGRARTTCTWPVT